MLDLAKKKHALEVAVARPDREETPDPNDCLYRISRGLDSHHRNIREMREHYAKYGEFFSDFDQMFNCLGGWQAQTHVYQLAKRDLEEATKDAAKRADRERYSGTYAIKCGVMKVSECIKSNLERLNKAKKIVVNKAKRDANKASTYPASAELVVAQETANIALRRITELTDVVAKQVEADNVVADAEEEQWDDRTWAEGNAYMEVIQRGDDNYESPYAPGYRLRVYRNGYTEEESIRDSLDEML